MSRRLLIALSALVALWAVVAWLVSRLLAGVDGNLLGFIGTVVMFYPTADIELRKWLLRKERRPAEAAAPSRTKAKKAWDELEAELRGDAEAALSLFNWWHMAAYTAGLTLIAAGFLSAYLAAS